MTCMTSPFFFCHFKLVKRLLISFPFTVSEDLFSSNRDIAGLVGEF